MTYDTLTMARIYAQQGYLRQAAAIYRRLQHHESQHPELAEELADVERRIAAQKGPSPRELGLLIKQWADLIQQQKNRQP